MCSLMVSVTSLCLRCVLETTHFFFWPSAASWLSIFCTWSISAVVTSKNLMEKCDTHFIFPLCQGAAFPCSHTGPGFVLSRNVSHMQWEIETSLLGWPLRDLWAGALGNFRPPSLRSLMCPEQRCRREASWSWWRVLPCSVGAKSDIADKL